MLKLLTSPIISLICLIIGTQYFQVFITIAMTQSGYSTTDIGIVHSASYAGFLLAAIYCERLIVRIGHIRAFTTFSGVIAATILLQSLWINLYLWTALRAAYGVALGGFYVAIESWLLSESDTSNRGQRLGRYMFVLYSSQALGPQLLQLINSHSLQPYIVSGLVCVLGVIPVSLTYKPTPVLTQQQSLQIGPIFRCSPYSCLGCFVSGLVLSAFYSFLPKFASDTAISISMTMTTLITGGFLLQWPIGKVSDIFNREKVLVAIGLCATLPCLLLLTAPSPPIAYLSLFLLGGFGFSIYTVCIALTCDRITNNNVVQATGVLLFAYGIGSVLGPLLAGFGISSVNRGEMLFVYATLMLGSFTTVGLFKWPNIEFLTRRKTVDPVEYIPVPRQTPVATKLDPRQELEPDTTQLVPASANDDTVGIPNPTSNPAVNPEGNHE